MTNKKSNLQDLYELKCGESMQNNCKEFVRVPGGWVCSDFSMDNAITNCFIPYSDEFFPEEEDTRPPPTSPLKAISGQNI